MSIRHTTIDHLAGMSYIQVLNLSFLGYLMATALAGEPIPPGAFIGALTRNIS